MDNTTTPAGQALDDRALVMAALETSQFGPRAIAIVKSVLIDGLSQRRAALLHGASAAYASATMRRYRRLLGRGAHVTMLRASLKRWVAECTEPAPGYRLSPEQVINAYLAWPQAVLASAYEVATELVVGIDGLDRQIIERALYVGRRLRPVPAAPSDGGDDI